MASATIKTGGVFPAGTSVAAYAVDSWNYLPSSGTTGLGAVVETATVAADSTLTFTDLDYAQRYVAYAVVSGAHRYLRFSTPPDDSVETFIIDVTKGPYNAAFDNSTDDTQAIQDALDAAVQENPPGTSVANDRPARIVQLPPAMGRVAGTLTIPANVHLRGHGPSSSYLIRPDGGPATAVVVVEGTGVQQLVSDLGIICNDADVDCLSVAGGNGASILTDMRVIVRDVVLVGGRDGLSSKNTDGQGNELRLSRVTAQRTTRNGFWIDTTDAFLEGCTSAQAGHGDTQPESWGFRIQGGNSRIYGCKAFGQRGNAGGGFSIGGSGRHQVACCETQDCENDGYSVAAGGTDPCVLSACVSDSCGRFGFNLGTTCQVSACAVMDRGGGLYTHEAAVLSGSADSQVRGMDTGTVKKLADNNGATADFYKDSNLDLANRSGTQHVAYAATVTPDPWEGQDLFLGQLTGDITIANPATSTDPSGWYPHGMKLNLYLTQDATGRTVTFGAGYKTTAAIPTTADSHTAVSFAWDGTNWREIGRATT